MKDWGEVWDTIIRINPTLKEGELGLRIDGRVEWQCEHGVGHTVWVEPKYRKQKAWWSHGCDNCCIKSKEFKAVKRRLKKSLG